MRCCFNDIPKNDTLTAKSVAALNNKKMLVVIASSTIISDAKPKIDYSKT